MRVCAHCAASLKVKRRQLEPSCPPNEHCLSARLFTKISLRLTIFSSIFSVLFIFLSLFKAEEAAIIRADEKLIFPKIEDMHLPDNRRLIDFEKMNIVQFVIIAILWKVNFARFTVKGLCKMFLNSE
jgi:hypothetical protein